MTPNPLQDGILRAVRRAEIPGLLFAEDIEVHLGIPAVEARRAIRDGLLGPWFTVRGNPAVQRETLREHFKLLAVQERPENREVLEPHDRAGESPEVRHDIS